MNAATLQKPGPLTARPSYKEKTVRNVLNFCASRVVVSVNLEGYFEKLKTDGTLDSTGIFTLDPDRVQWKLAKFQLAEPRMFPLFLVKAAVSGNCQSFERDSADTSQGEVKYILRGLVFDRSELQNLHLAALGQGTTDPAKFLMVAFSAASGIGRAKLTTTDGTDSFGLESSGEKVSFHEDRYEDPRFQGTVFSFVPDKSEPSHGLLYFRTRYSPVPLSYLQADRFQCLTLKEVPPSTFVVALGHQWQVADCLRDSPDVLACTVEHPALVALSWHTGDNSSIQGLHRGVTYPLGLEFDHPGFSGVIDCNELELDVSYSGFIQNSKFENKLEQVEELLKEVMYSVLVSQRRWSEKQKNLIRDSADKRWPKGCQPLLQFLNSQGSMAVPYEHELETLLKEHPKLASSSRREDLFRSYRTSITALRVHNLHEAEERAKLELHCCRATGRDTRDSQQLLNALVALQRGLQPPLNDDGPLAKLTLVAGKHTRLQEVDLSDCHPDWSRHLGWFQKLESGDHRCQEELLDDARAPAALKLCVWLDRGGPKEVFNFIRESREPALRRFRGYWLAKLQHEFRGRLSWSQQVWLTVSTTLLRRDDEASNRLIAAERSLLGHRNLLPAYVVFHQHFWTLVACYRHFKLPSGEQREALWATILLQAAIGLPGTSDTMEANLQKRLALPLYLSA